jgi:hypothetical protein
LTVTLGFGPASSDERVVILVPLEFLGLSPHFIRLGVLIRLTCLGSSEIQLPGSLFGEIVGVRFGIVYRLGFCNIA